MQKERSFFPLTMLGTMKVTMKLLREEKNFHTNFLSLEGVKRDKLRERV